MVTIKSNTRVFSPDGQGNPAFVPTAAQPVLTPAAPRPVTVAVNTTATSKHPPLAHKRPAKKAEGKRGVARKGQGKGVKRAARAKKGEGKTPQRRTAPISVDFQQAIAVLGSAKRKDMAAIQAIVGQLNPMPKASRKRIMDAVGTILG